MSHIIKKNNGIKIMENNDTNLTSFDTMTFSNRLQILKTFFPYMPAGSQKFISSYIKISELSNALKMCSDNSNAELSACSSDTQKSPFELLSEIKPFCSKNEKDNIDVALNFVNAFQMYRSFMEVEKESEGNEKTSFFDTIKNMLTPEQQTMFDNYQTVLNNAAN